MGHTNKRLKKKILRKKYHISLSNKKLQEERGQIAPNGVKSFMNDPYPESCCY